MTDTITALRWHRSEFGMYADSPTEPIRYYVRREGTSRANAPWLTEAFPTITVAGVTVVKSGTNARWIDHHQPTQTIAKAIAEAYETEPERTDGKATNRLTRAIERAYKA